MSRILVVVTWTLVILCTCPAGESSVASGISDGEPQQRLDEPKLKAKSPMEWIHHYLVKYYGTRHGSGQDVDLDSNGSDNGLSASTGRQMPTQSSLGDAIAVGGLALLFINQVAAALNVPFLLPFLLIPVAVLTLSVKFLSNADSNGEIVTQFLRSGVGWDS